MSGLICKGNVKFDRFDSSGVATGKYRDLENVVQLEITENSEVKERMSKRRDTYGQTLDVATIKGTATFSMTTDNITGENLALVFLGDSSVYTQSAGSIPSSTAENLTAALDVWVSLDNESITDVVVKDVTDVTTYVLDTDYELDASGGRIKALSTGSISDEDVLHVTYKLNRAGYPGYYIDLPHRDVSALVITNADGSTTYVSGTDYELDSAPGMVKILADGNITEGQALDVVYDYAAITGTKMEGGGNPTIKGRLKMDGENLATGERIELDIYEAQIVPTGGVDFMSEDFVNIPLEGRIITPTGNTTGYDVVTI